MKDEEKKVEEAFQTCANVRLPDDFADRLVTRIRESKESEGKNVSIRTVFARIALVAASLTLLLGFVPNVLDQSSDRSEIVAHCDEIRPANQTVPQDSHLTTLAFLGFCREAIRRRVRSLLVRSRKREDED